MTVLCSEGAALLHDSLIVSSNSEASNSGLLSRVARPVTVIGPGFCHHTHVPHVAQLFSWDCGLACVLMVLRAAGFHHVDYSLLRQLCPTTSIWTIDLAVLLRAFGVPVTLSTTTLGINSSYAHESFYMEHLEEDERRVVQLFKEAGARGIALQQASLGARQLQQLLLAGGHLVIALTDKRRLSPWLAAADMCLPSLCGLDIGYAGHYVVLAGYDAVHREYIIRDPAGSARCLKVAEAQMEAARTSFGTDEDLLLIPLPQPGAGQVAPQVPQVPGQQVQQQCKQPPAGDVVAPCLAMPRKQGTWLELACS